MFILSSLPSGNTLAAVSESVTPFNPHSSYSSTLQSASKTALSALGYTGALMRSLMNSRACGEEPLSLSTPQISTVGFHGHPSKLLCTDDDNTRQSKQSNQSQTRPSPSSSSDKSESHPRCQFLIPPSLSAQLKNQSSEVVQIVLNMDGGSEFNPLLTAADPPISTTLAAMEFTTPQGQPIHIQDLDPDQAIRVTLPNKRPLGLGAAGSGYGGRGGYWVRNGSVGEDGDVTRPMGVNMTLPDEGWLNFTVKSVEGLDDSAGQYISFNFSLAPGTATCFSNYRFK